MRILKHTPFEVCHFTLQHRPGVPSSTIVVKGTFSIVPSGECPLAPVQRFPSGELHYDDDVAQSLRHPDDLAPFKPSGECFVLGHFHASHGQPVTHGRVAFMIGPIQKMLSVFGPRRWTLVGPSNPERMTQVALRWENALGDRSNPVGQREMPPQLEHASELLTSRSDARPPACTAPIHRGWPARADLAGTYDEGWLRAAYPYFPADFDWSYFCSAPPDQRIAGYWRGDEEIALLNVIPGAPQVLCRLPGLRPRAGWVLGDDPAARPQVREITLVLDTITVDGDAGEVSLVWRGTGTAPEGCTNLAVVHQALHEKTSLTRAAYWMLRRERHENAVEEPPAPSAPNAPSPAVASSVKSAAERQAARGGDPASVPAQLAAALGGASPAPRPFEEASASALSARAQHLERDRLERGGGMRRRLARAIRAGESCAGWDLARADLSGVELSGVDLEGADLTGANLRGARLRDVSLDHAMLDGADLSAAIFTQVSMPEASLVRAIAESARFEGCNIGHAILDGLTAPGARFFHARGPSAHFRGANLVAAAFEECDLTLADFGEAKLAGAAFTRTDLAEAFLGDGTVLSRARFSQCNLRALRAFGSIADGIFIAESPAPRARFGGAMLADARFFDVNLERADFAGADLARASFGRARLRKARFDGASLVEARLLAADLFQARMTGCDLTRADLRGANLFQAELFRAMLEGALLDLAETGGTRLEERA
jgi:uncharacterized protein YjbI with pentapeptide repeats